MPSNQPDLRMKSIEIVGLSHGSNGRTCGLHEECCGTLVKPAIYLKLRKGLTDIFIDVEEEVDLYSTEVTSARSKKRKKGKKSAQTKMVKRLISTETVKAFDWNGGVEGCLVGFVSEAFQELYGRDLLDGRVVQIVKLGFDSNSESERHRSIENGGLALGLIQM